jgi:uncharacterized peroxidase-related enzyme
MPHLEPLPREDLPQYDEWFSMMEERAGFLPNVFATMARRPDILDAARNLFTVVFSGSVDREIKSLVALMSSYGAGCRYCQAHQATSLVHQGVAPEKLERIADFERSDLYTERERAAMRMAFASGQQPNAVTAQHFDDLRKFFDDGEIVEIVSVIATFGFLNRWHETVATALEDRPEAIATATLGGLDWEPGRHADTAR